MQWSLSPTPQCPGLYRVGERGRPPRLRGRRFAPSHRKGDRPSQALGWQPPNSNAFRCSSLVGYIQKRSNDRMASMRPRIRSPIASAQSTIISKIPISSSSIPLWLRYPYYRPGTVSLQSSPTSGEEGPDPEDPEVIFPIPSHGYSPYYGRGAPAQRTVTVRTRQGPHGTCQQPSQ